MIPSDNRLSFENTESASNDSSYESEDLRQSYWSPSYASSQRNRYDKFVKKNWPTNFDQKSKLRQKMKVFTKKKQLF